MSSQESLMIHVLALCSKYRMCPTAASLHIQWEAGLIIFCILAARGTVATSSFKAYFLHIVNNYISNGNRLKEKRWILHAFPELHRMDCISRWSSVAENREVGCFRLICVTVAAQSSSSIWTADIWFIWFHTLEENLIHKIKYCVGCLKKKLLRILI